MRTNDRQLEWLIRVMESKSLCRKASADTREIFGQVVTALRELKQLRAQKSVIPVEGTVR